LVDNIVANCYYVNPSLVETFVPENRTPNVGNQRHPSSCSQAWYSHMETLVSLWYIVRLSWHLSPIHNNPKIPISPHHHGNMYADSSCQKNKNFTTNHHLGSFFYSVATDPTRKSILQDWRVATSTRKIIERIGDAIFLHWQDVVSLVLPDLLWIFLKYLLPLLKQ
jgi:hypothetical protein